MEYEIKNVKMVQIKEDNLPSILKLLNGNKDVKQVQWGTDKKFKRFNIILDIEIAKGKEISLAIYNNEYLVMSENGEINIAFDIPKSLIKG